MASFEVEIGGKTYEVEAADQGSALEAVRSMTGASSRADASSRPIDIGSDGVSGDAIRAYAATAPQSALASEMRGKDARAAFDAMPWYRKAGTAADDIMRLAADGMTFGYADKLAAGMSSLTGGNYADAIKDQRQATEDARSRAGIAGTAAELGGGLATGLGTLRAGATASRFIPQAMTGGSRVAALMGAGAADGAAMGALSGAGHTDDGNYAGNMTGQALIGAGVGGAVPGVVAGIGKAVQPISNAVMANFMPETFARRAAVNTMDRAGMTADDVRQKMLGAATAGQPDYIVADALGNGGARALNGIARGNDPVASTIQQQLAQRQAAQGGRIESIIREGMDAPTTAKQLADKIGGIKKAKADAQYAAARAEAGAVDPTGAIEAIDRIASPGVLADMTKGGLSDSSPIRALLSSRRMLTDGQTMVSDFERAFLAKLEMDKAVQSGTSALKPARRALDDALAGASAPYAQARNTFRNLSKVEEAIEQGRSLGQRGRADDTIDAFRGMSPQEAGAARYGYADAILERAGKLGEGANKARALTAGKYTQEMGAVAPPQRGPLMMERLGREGEMFETNRIATGGSQTANNIADMIGAGTAVGAGGVYDMLGGSGGLNGGMTLAGALALRRGIQRAGASPSDEARRRLARALLSSNPNEIARMASRSIRNRGIKEDTIATIARLLGAGSVPGALSYQNLGGNP